MRTIQPTALTDEELAHYAQMFLDKKEALPDTWVQELLRRFILTLDDMK